MDLLANVKAGFSEVYFHSPKFVIKAPGRVNLIGEHTDYNDGFVLPCAIKYATLIAVSPRTDDIISVHALDYADQRDEFSLNDKIEFLSDKMWANYVRGVVSELLKKGYALQGCNLSITGNVPQGAGLSSSAALEVGVAQTFNTLCSLDISKQDIALISQAAENNFVGCACGIMDQLISACGQEQMAVGIDCRTLALTEVSIPKGMTILMINSNVKRGLVDSEYNLRRQQCEQAAIFFGVSHLRDVSVEEFEANKQGLDEIVSKRAEHIVYENQRTLDAMYYFNQNNISVISQLMAQSHQSMKELFEITVPQIDFLVDLIASVIGDKGGVRMTGGGFGGCVVALVPDELVAKVKREVEKNYEHKSGIKETIYTSQPVIGVHVIEGI